MNDNILRSISSFQIVDRVAQKRRSIPLLLSMCKNRITCLRQFNKKVYKHLIMLQKQQAKPETQTGCISGLFYIKELINIEKFVNNSVRPI